MPLFGTQIVRAALLLSTLAALGRVATAQTAQRADTGSALPITPVRTLRFTTDEGTWMSLDVSPDGRTILFDLLGDLYTVPIDGGDATRRTSGMAWDYMPRWSPDGSTIAFASDRGGNEDIWLMDRNGGHLRRLTHEVDARLSSPTWTRDGQYIIARRTEPYPGPNDYGRQHPLWMYAIAGGTGVQIVPATLDAPKTSNSGPAFSPDGNTMYFSSHAGGSFSAEGRIGLFQIISLDRRTGRQHALTSAPGGGLRPAVSPDGHWLVYATRFEATTGFRIRDLQTGAERWLVARTQRDDQEGDVMLDALPNYSFTPDSKSVVYTEGGKIRRVDIATRAVTTIPFTAHVELGMGRHLQAPQRIDDGPLHVRQLTSINESADHKRVVFSAVGRIWTANVSGNQIANARHLTPEGSREFQPSLSPNGEWVAYVTWSDSAGGYLWKARADGSGTPIRLTKAAGFYKFPAWAPEGDRVAFLAWPTSAGQGTGSGPGELTWIDVDKPDSRHVIGESTASLALVSRGGDASGRVYYLDISPAVGGNLARVTTTLRSVRYDGTDGRVHARVRAPIVFAPNGPPGPVAMRVSPDGERVVMVSRDDAYLFPLTPLGTEGVTLDMERSATGLPLRRVTYDGANEAGWADDGHTLTWSFTDRYFRANADSVFATADSTKWHVERLDVALTVPRAAPTGALLLKGGRVITMRGDDVLSSGDVLIENNRITRVGKSIAAPAGVRVIDMTGKTLMPGLVDVHSHMRTGRDIAYDNEWSTVANLAYGVTTTRNPSTGWGTYAYGEMVDAGTMIGPRIFSTGPPFTGTNVPLRNYDDALRAVRRYEAEGANSLKQYVQPRRVQRQWILQAALAEGIDATNEGAGDFRADMSMAIDGYTSLEHTLPMVPIYKDVVTVLADSKITYTPALNAQYGAPEGDTYWRARYDLRADAKTRRFTPRDQLDRATRELPLIHDDEYTFTLAAQGLRDVVRAGGNIGMGSHGQQNGIGADWELWMMQSGGMTPLETLRAATMMGAASIGLDRDIGSIEPGKLADIVVLDANPLDDIKNTIKTRYIIKNGFVYDAATLDEIWPTARKFPTSVWARDEMDRDGIRIRP